MLLGFVPAGYGVGVESTGAEGALTTIELRGTAVGFVATKEKEGVGPVGVGNREVEPLTLTLEPTTLEPAAEATLDAEEETADAT